MISDLTLYWMINCDSDKIQRKVFIGVVQELKNQIIFLWRPEVLATSKMSFVAFRRWRACYSKTSVTVYKTTRCHNLEAHELSNSSLFTDYDLYIILIQE
jgi:hypothetical protein